VIPSRAALSALHPTCTVCGADARDHYRYRAHGQLEPKRKHEPGGPDGLKFAAANWPAEPWLCGACRVAVAAPGTGSAGPLPFRPHAPGDGAGDEPLRQPA
jgi:hypothetical protein